MGGGVVVISLTTRMGEIVCHEKELKLTAKRRVEDDRQKGWKGAVRPCLR